MPRRRSALILIFSLVFLAVGVLFLERTLVVAWLAFILGGAGVVASSLELVLPSRLLLNAGGFTLWRPARRPRVQNWTDCGPFETVEVSRQSLVGYRVHTSESEKYIGPGYGGLTAPELADLINGYRMRALGRL
jgi:hypothetical protein